MAGPHLPALLAGIGRRLRQVTLVATLLTASALPAAGSPGWAGFYDADELRQWHGEYVAPITDLLHKDVLPLLPPADRRALGPVRLSFPHENSNHLLNVMSNPQTGVIVLPVSSLRFLADICIAHAWLNHHGRTTQPVTDYLLILKYQGMAAFSGQPRRPLQALGLPATARDEAAVQKTAQQMFGTALAYLLGHELGHLLHRHTDEAGSPEQARAREVAADRYALQVMQRLGMAPLGIVSFFMAYAHLDAMAGDPDFPERRQQATHPTSTSRLLALTQSLRATPRAFGDTPNKQRAVLYVATEIETLALLLADPGAQQLMRQRGLTTPAASLLPKAKTATQEGATDQAGQWHGNWQGKWWQIKAGGAVDLPITLQLQKNGTAHRGGFEFPGGYVNVEGQMQGEQLHFAWRWGKEHFGRGVFMLAADGRMQGSWGYNAQSSGAGTFELARAP